MADENKDPITVQTAINAVQESCTDLTKLMDEVEKGVNEKGAKEYFDANSFSLFPVFSTLITMATKLNCNSSESLMNTLEEFKSKEGDNKELSTALEEFNLIKSAFDDVLQLLDDQLAIETKKTLTPKELELEIPETSQLIKLEDLLAKKKYTWVVFLRNYFCPLCQNHTEALADAKDKLMDLECQVILIAPGEAKGVALFKNDVKCPFEIYLDPSESNEVYWNYGMGKSLKKMFGTHTWPLCVDYVFGNGRIGKPYEWVRDEPLNMGGDIVFDSAGEIVYSNSSKHFMDRPKPSVVLDLLGQ